MSDAKEKAQLTATTAMSIVHITLLKQVLDRGPNMPYYSLLLGLIITALVLQFFAGVTAILLSNIRKHYSRYASICGGYRVGVAGESVYL